MKFKIFSLFLCLAFASQVFGASQTKPGEVAAIVAGAATYQSGDDAGPLRQVEALVRESSANSALRKPLETELLKLLAPTATIEARRFACKQLAIIGSDRALPAIADLLNGEETVGFACLALSTYPPGKADKILRDALPASQGLARVQVIETLGDRRDAKAVEALAAIVRENQFAPTRAAIIALAKIGDTPARKALAELRGTSSAELERWFTEADIRIAEQLAKSGNRKAAAAIYASLLGPSQPESVRRGAFAAILPLDKDGGEERVLRTLRGSDDILKPVAIGAVRILPSKQASKQFGLELPALPPEQQVWLIESLTVRNDADARAVIITTLAASTNSTVRQSAASALGRIGDASTAGSLAWALAAAKDDAEVRVIESALAALPGGLETDKAVLVEMKRASGQTRARLISSLRTRRSPEVIAALFEETVNPDPAPAKAAFRVLSKAVTTNNLALLLTKFDRLGDVKLQADVETSVEQAVLNIDSNAARSKAVRDVLAGAFKANSRAALVRLLPACGDANALNVLKRAINEPEPLVRDAAVSALADWPDNTAWDALLEVYRHPRDERYRVIALRGLVRMLGEQNAKPDAKLVERYRDLLEGTRDSDRIKLILGALGGAAHPDALKLAVSQLGDSRVRPEAEVAVKKIAESIKDKYPDAAKKALDLLPPKP